MLGTAFANGCLGLGEDEAEAKKWYEKMPGCAVKDADDASREKAREWLQLH